VVQFHDLPGHGKTQPVAPALAGPGPVPPIEPLEDVRQTLFGDTGLEIAAEGRMAPNGTSSPMSWSSAWTTGTMTTRTTGMTMAEANPY
jgi:hypothetical protein